MLEDDQPGPPTAPPANFKSSKRAWTRAPSSEKKNNKK